MKKRNLFMSTTLICGFFAVAFTFKIEQITWLWTNHKPVGVILLLFTFVLAVQWYKAQRLWNRSK